MVCARRRLQTQSTRSVAEGEMMRNQQQQQQQLTLMMDISDDQAHRAVNRDDAVELCRREDVWMVMRDAYRFGRL